MFKHFVSLQWKSFFRSASLQNSILIKIVMAFAALYMTTVFVGLGVGLYYLIDKELQVDPLQMVNKFMIYYIVIDLITRYFLQKMPVVNIKPLLHLPIKKSKIINFTLGKTILSYFNIVHAFLFVPFSIILVIEGYPIWQVVGWHLAILCILYCNNFLNILINNKDRWFYIVAGVVVLFAASQYFKLFDITDFTGPIFDFFYNHPITAIIPLALLILLYVLSSNYFKKNLFLDAGLATKQEEAKTENLTWLDRFGSLGTFLKNDIKLIKRNKRSKTTVFISLAFLFYGLLFFTNSIEAYEGPFWKIFAGIFVSGGFLFTFGQFVPSWDSAYYPLMMSQNIRYKEYLLSKWYLIVIATIVSTFIASFYLYFGWEVYLAIIAGAIYNIGINAYLVLWGGAYIKTPIDLASSKKAFGDKQAFNLKSMLLTIPKLLLPGVIYLLVDMAFGSTAGFLAVALTGIIGFAFRNFAFKQIEKIYKREKYKTLAAYKQTK